MEALEATQRAAVVAEARTWLKTPYVPEGDVKRGGVDCGMILVRVFCDLGLVEPFDPRPYSRTWMMHRDEEKYLQIVLRLAGEIEGPPLPGDLILWRVGRQFAHGGIVTEWPKVVHAWAKARMVVETDVSLKGVYETVPRRFFSFWAKQYG